MCTYYLCTHKHSKCYMSHPGCLIPVLRCWCRADDSRGTLEIFCSFQNIQEAFLCQRLKLVGGEGVIEWWIRLGLCPSSLPSLVKRQDVHPSFQVGGGANPLFPWRTLVTAGDIFDYHNWRGKCHWYLKDAASHPIMQKHRLPTAENYPVPKSIVQGQEALC